MALVNLAWFSAGENALVVTTGCCIIASSVSEADIPFDDLPGRKIEVDGSYMTVGDHSLGIGGTGTAGSTIEAMLKAVVKACEARHRELQGAIGS